jgi:DamX protein
MQNPADSADLAEQIAALRADLAQHKQDLQTTETALVSRIADVDDDRRLTTNRLQRSWQTHHDEVNARLKRQNSVLLGGLLSLAVVLALGLFFAYGHLDSVRRALLAEGAQLRLDYQRLNAVAAQESAIQESMRELRDSVSVLSDTLDASIANRDAVPAPATPEPTSAAQRDPDAQTAPPPPETMLEALEAVTPGPVDGEAATESADPPLPETASVPPTAPADRDARADALEGLAPPVAEQVTQTPAPSEDKQPAGEDTPTDGSAEGAAGNGTPRLESPVVPAASADPDSGLAVSPPPSESTDPAIPPEPTDTAANTNTPPEPVPERSAPTEDPGLEPRPGPSASTGTGTPQVAVADQPLLIDERPFALQLIGFYSLDSLLDFARREQLPRNVYFREESYQGRPWFVLIHSLYARDQDAKEAIEALPKELAMLDIWVRNLTPGTTLGVVEITPGAHQETP